MTNSKNFIITKNIHRQGKGELHTSTGVTILEVKKIGKLYYLIINETRNGLNRIDANEAWVLMSEYLSAELVEDKNLKVK